MQKDTLTLDQTYVADTYGHRFPLSLSRGQGSEVWDESGKHYIDLGTGIAVNTFGLADPEWAAAVTAQLNKLQHTSNLYYHAPVANLAALLCEKTGMKKVFFSNSGAEANECAIKAARKYAHDRYGEGRSTIVTLEQSFHGRTVTTLAATGQAVFHTNFGPFTPGFVHVPPDDLAAMERALSENDCAAVFLELVQGEGGVHALDLAYVRGVYELARAKDVLFVVDEVQTGNGRTGSLYAWQQYGVTPDIFSTAKGLAGGLPMGATLFSEKTQDVLQKGQHGSTFGGNPVCAAGAYSILSRIDDALLAQVREKAAYIRQELTGSPGVRHIDGLGLMLGILTDKPASEIADACLAKGLLVLTAKDRVRLLPALNIPQALLAEAIAILKEVIAP